MKMKQYKQQKMYNAIHDAVMELRIEIQRAKKDKKPISTEGFDKLLFGIPDAVWSEQKHILNLKN